MTAAWFVAAVGVDHLEVDAFIGCKTAAGNRNRLPCLIGGMVGHERGSRLGLGALRPGNHCEGGSENGPKRNQDYPMKIVRHDHVSFKSP